jgi:hypothetical protein
VVHTPEGLVRTPNEIRFFTFNQLFEGCSHSFFWKGEESSDILFIFLA